jgi:predicted MFS family arabinose efflux permease
MILKEFLSPQLQEIILDSLTVLVISIFFAGEVLIIFSQFIQKQFTPSSQKSPAFYTYVRPAAFLFYFGVYLSLSFLPLYMETLYDPFPGVSKDLMMGLPISAEMFFAGICIFIAGIWSDRRGWHEPFYSGIFLSAMGLLYSWTAQNALHFIIARSVAGMGYGLFWMASQGFVISATDENTKSQGFAQLFAGMFGGTVCGCVTGAILAERIGYKPVFFIGAVMMFAVIAYTLFFMQKAAGKLKYRSDSRSLSGMKIRELADFLFNRNILVLLLLSAIPASIAMIGVLNYFTPVYLSRIGTSQSNIGRILMIYDFCVIYMGPVISKYIDASENKKMYVVASGILGGLAFITFYFLGGIGASIIAVLILGISQSFVFVSQNAYILKLKITKEMGEGKALGLFRSVSRFGQVIGPVLFGWLIVTMDIHKSIAYFGMFYLFITILFGILAREHQATEKNTRPLNELKIEN